ncbi:MAG: 30S ribosomal protein S6e [Candidatus Methanomethyliaceae archaeon]|nr:30S ribosomal protein S6e [Candidatus Methanomethyliaceae archaeon]
MVEFKFVISNPSDGQSKTVTVADAQAQSLIGLQIGDSVNGEAFGFSGQELVITGGSDKSGIPIRGDIPGGGKRKILLSGTPGFHPKESGARKRKFVRGNMITEDIVQINAVVKKVGESVKKSE